MSDKPKRKRDWEGRYVRIRYDMETKGGTIFRAGETLRIYRNYGGLWLEGLRSCPCCNSEYRRRAIIKIPERDVFLLPPDYVPPDEPPHLDMVHLLDKETRKALGAIRANVEQSLKDGYGCPFCKRADGQYVDGEYWHDDDCPYELLVPRPEAA